MSKDSLIKLLNASIANDQKAIRATTLYIDTLKARIAQSQDTLQRIQAEAE